MTPTEMLEKVMKREDRVSRMAVANLLKLVIPFNAPHGFHLAALNKDEVRIELPNNKLNQNHVGGVHACAIATLGEFCAGLTLARHLGLTRYRFLLAKLQVDYHKQGRTRLTGVARLDVARVDQLKEELKTSEKLLFEHHTEISDAAGDKIADVISVWQIKDWNKVRLK